jgi:phosphoserine/homoserine phosphotransferase
VEFAGPLMKKLGWPTLFCHDLTLDENGAIAGYNLRQHDSKRETVKALKGLNYHVLAMGDSYNDISMLQEADAGILFRPPENVVREYPRFPVTESYAELKSAICKETGIGG